DEQRIASPEFANDPWKAMPAMVVSATISTSPTMIYSGQEVGEDAAEKAGFGDPSRTSIFDYIGVPAHQRWMNEGKFDGGQLYDTEKNLRAAYVKLLNFTLNSDALMGKYQQLYHPDNGPQRLGGKAYAFARWSENEKLIIATNFDWQNPLLGGLNLSKELTSEWGLADGSYEVTDQLGEAHGSLEVKDGYGYFNFQLGKLESGIWRLD
ncbi:MAG: hypothetical protein ACI9ZX_001160, partial [Algoriphagus sp.]